MTNRERKAIAVALAEEGFVVTQAEVNHVLGELRQDSPETDEDADAYLESLIDDAVDSIYSRTGDRKVCGIYRAGLEDALELARGERLAFGPEEDYWFDTQEKENRGG